MDPKLIAIGVALSLAAGCGPSGPKPVDAAALVNAAQNSAEWLTTGRDYAETHYSPLDQINDANVSQLGVAWSYDTGTHRGLEATPLVHNGVLYGTTSWSRVFALDAVTGAVKWEWDPEVDPAYGQRACCDVVNRGVALYEGKVFVGVLDGRLAALDAETGTPIWQVQTTAPNQPYTITGAPRVVKGNVIIGNGGAEYGVRGFVTAYDAETGNLAWRFYIVPGDPSQPFENPALEAAAATWSTGDPSNPGWWTMGGGGTPWDGMAYDPEADLLYVGTGNGSPWDRDVRSPGGGDNLYLSSILALNPDTGDLVWYYQTTPGDSWDFTAVQPLMLADLTIGGAARKVIMQAPKNGFFYVLDRITGELLSATPYARVTWASGVDMATGRPVEVPEARYPEGVSLLYPGPNGAHNWQPMSFNPNTGLVYIPAQNAPFPYSHDAEFEFHQGQWNLGVGNPPRGVPAEPASAPTDPAAPGVLVAWDPVAAAPRWQVDYEASWNGGTLTTAGNLVFQGIADGRFIAYTADTGDKLWEVSLGTGVMAAASTYEIDGVQYLSVLAGWGGATAQFGTSYTDTFKAPGRLWTFVLNGTAPLQPVSGQPHPELTPIESNASAATVARGSDLYTHWCSMCHGVNAVSGGTIADLRYAAPATLANIQSIVREGAYLGVGMPNFGDWLSEDEVEAIRAFVVSRRAALMAGN